MKHYAGLCLILGVLQTGCLPVRPDVNPPAITQLQSRAIQTRTYSGVDHKTVIKTVFNVLQDEGFIVHYGDSELGLLNASKNLIEFDSTDFDGQFLASLAGGVENTVSSIDATANISEFGKQIKVRMNFQRKLLNLDQKPLDMAQINDPKFYQEFFVKVDKGLFIEQQGL